MKFLCATDYALCQLEVTEIGKVIKRNIEINKEKFQKNAGKTNPGNTISNINQRCVRQQGCLRKKIKEKTGLIQLNRTGRNVSFDVGAIKVMQQ